MSTNIIERGSTYRVLRDFTHGTPTFLAGETLIFLQIFYFWYDDDYWHIFIAESDGTEKTWRQNSRMPKEDWRDHFELIEVLPAIPRKYLRSDYDPGLYPGSRYRVLRDLVGFWNFRAGELVICTHFWLPGPNGNDYVCTFRGADGKHMVLRVPGGEFEQMWPDHFELVPPPNQGSPATIPSKETLKRQAQFAPYARYRAKRSFGTGEVDRFEAGDIVAFESHIYSTCESAFYYYFVREDDAAMKRWCLPDGEPDKVWTDDFALLGPADWAVRKSTPVLGSKYRVLQGSANGIPVLMAGEGLLLQRIITSNDVDIYLFTSEVNGIEIIWAQNRKMPKKDWRDYIEPIPGVRPITPQSHSLTFYEPELYPGSRHRVVQNFSETSEFAEGEIVTCIGRRQVIVGDFDVCVFTDAKGNAKVLKLPSGEVETKWADHFEFVPDG